MTKNKMMKPKERHDLKRFGKFIAFIIIGIPLFTWVTMLLWNWLMPMIFGLMTLTFWQTMGVLLLSKILLSGFGRGGHNGMHTKHGWKYKMKEKMRNMTPEEKDAFKQKMKEKWRKGDCGPLLKDNDLQENILSDSKE